MTGGSGLTCFGVGCAGAGSMAGFCGMAWNSTAARRRPLDKSNAQCSSDVPSADLSLSRMTPIVYSTRSIPPAGVESRRFWLVYSIHDAPACTFLMHVAR